MTSGALLAGPIWESTTDFVLFFGAVIVLAIAGMALTIIGAVRAVARGDTGWLVAIIGAFFFGASWLVALIYLLATRTPRVRDVAQTPSYRTQYCMTCGQPAAAGANFCRTCGGQIKVQERRPFR